MEVFKTEREEISVFDVPNDIRRKIEGSPAITIENFYSDYEKAENYYYGLNGFPQNRNQAKNFYAKAAKAGNSEARKKLQDLIYLEKNYGF